MTGGVDLSLTKKDIRKFGIVAFLFFGFLCFLGIWRHRAVPVYLFGVLAVIGLGFIMLPVRLRPVYNGWLRIAHFIGKILTALMLIIAYYLVITPAGLIKRMFSGSPLPLKPDIDISSYWITRDEPAQPKDRFIKRY